MALIVVGVDGSAQSKQALVWAADEARSHKATLRVVMAWDNPNRDMWIPRLAAGTNDPLHHTRAALNRVVKAVLGERTRLAVEQVAAEGPAAKVLMDAAKDADLLVVGSRGRGGFGGVVLGSVGLHCASHAPCPVVIVRGRVAAATQPATGAAGTKAKTASSASGRAR